MSGIDRTPQRGAANWFKSSYSEVGSCVEVSVLISGVAVRDSKDPGGPVLWFTPDEWAAFIAGAKAGEFDLN